MPTSTETRKLGLHQVFPDPRDVVKSAKQDIDIIAIHGLDTHSPKTWMAWKEDGKRDSGDVHWLRDEHMLPSVIQNARIFTYDWNANYDGDAETQSLRGHADSLLNKLRNARNKENKSRPIVFVASCFGGILLAKALNQASSNHGKYRDILDSTSGIVFLGTPFYGAHPGFNSAIELRYAVALSQNAEVSDELLHYLVQEPDSELIRSFCELIQNTRKRIICFYETRRTNFGAVISKLPDSFKSGLDAENMGILVPEPSARLPGHDVRSLSVRHAMLNKYGKADDESFKDVSSAIKELVDVAQGEVVRKMSLADDPIGSEVAKWLRASRLGSQYDGNVDALIFKARMLEKLRAKTERGNSSILARLLPKAQQDLEESLWGLDIAVESAASAARKPNDNNPITRDFAQNMLNDITNKVQRVCQSAQDGVLLGLTENPDDVIDDDVMAIIEARSAMNLRQTIMDTSAGSDEVFDEFELPRNQVVYKRTREEAETARFRYGNLKGELVIVESFEYSPTEGSNNIPPRTLAIIKRMVERLSHPQRTSHHILSCWGYTQDRYNKRIGMVFSLGKMWNITKPPIALYDVYTKVKRVPLGLRFHIAYALADAIKGLHQVGWVHEELKSKNILLLQVKESITMSTATAGSSAGDYAGLDFKNPYLFGFRWSRPEEAETDLRADYSPDNNLYRHPDRWGKPVPFIKAHDVYSLGVVLFEIAYWRPISRICSKPDENQTLESKYYMHEMLKMVAGPDLPHLVGQSFARVIEVCLTFEDKTKNLDPYSTHKMFKVEILEVLERLQAANM
ncbi:hypothetical protein F5Y07DRAFT_367963 [Xylaria sp. FL0933]|nr:hypothetical protein F5Y07DRAFT_367963 [Xylaria sp. FL0933]